MSVRFYNVFLFGIYECLFFGLHGGGLTLQVCRQGVQRLMKLNNGISDTDLQTTESVMGFRAAKRVLENTDEWRGKDIPYWEVMKVKEQGLSGEYGTRYWTELNKVLREANPNDQGAWREFFVKMGFSYKETDTLLNEKDPKVVQEMMKNRSKEMPGTGAGEIPELKAKIESMNIRNMTIEAGQGFWDNGIWKAIFDARKDLRKTLDLGNAEYPAGTVENIAYEREAIMNSFFGHGGDASSDATAVGQFNDIFKTFKEEEMLSVFNKLGTIKDRGDAGDWDRHDVLNKIVSSGDSKAFLDKLDQLIELYKNDKTAIEIINEMKL